MQTFKKLTPRQMPFENFKKIVEDNLDYLKARNTRVTPYSRGEPLLHPQFWECCALLNKHGIAIGHISTNLSLNISIQDFVRHPIERIMVNIGGITKEVHEKCMVHSDFDLVTANLKALWTAGIPVQIKMNPTRHNIHQRDDLPAFVESLGGKPVFIQHYTTYFPNPDHTTQEEKRFFLDTVFLEGHEDLFRFSVTDNGAISQAQRTCPAGYMTDIIFSNGNYGICCHDDYEESIVGNAFTATIETIRNSGAYRKTYERGLKRQLPNCKYCS